MDSGLFTVITFAPVQGFITSSRKLRDLYGSSLLLSHLARSLAEDAKANGLVVISPASIRSSRGVPNVLVVSGDYRKSLAHDALLASWKRVLKTCRSWLERQLPPAEDFEWHSSWKSCGQHSWELFHGQGTTIREARAALAVNKLQRGWSVPNWTGESSTLSSATAVVWPRMGEVRDPRDLPPGMISDKARKFVGKLRGLQDLGEAFAKENEEISLTELVKRLITYPSLASTAFASEVDPTPILKDLLPKRFQDLSMIAKENETEIRNQSESIIWFMADGDGIGDHLESLKEHQGEEEALRSFSTSMRKWASGLYDKVPQVMEDQAIVVYAGGDDLFGALHESEPGANNLFTTHLWSWLSQFPGIWEQCGQAQLTVSMGLVWADAQVPQRDALQHARDAEASAKARGKNRFALRLLYANGNHLEWTCPWQWLDPILNHYTDREGRTAKRSHDGRLPSWRHLAEDLQWLQSRQAIAVTCGGAHAEQRSETCLSTARALWSAYFPGLALQPEPPIPPTRSGEEERFRASPDQPEKERRFDQWLLDLGRVMAGLEKHQPPRGGRG